MGMGPFWEGAVSPERPGGVLINIFDVGNVKKH